MSNSKRRNPIARGIGCLVLLVAVGAFLLVGVVGNVLAWAWSVLAEPRLPDSLVFVALVGILTLGPLYLARRARRAREEGDVDE